MVNFFTFWFFTVALFKFFERSSVTESVGISHAEILSPCAAATHSVKPKIILNLLIYSWKETKAQPLLQNVLPHVVYNYTFLPERSPNPKKFPKLT